MFGVIGAERTDVKHSINSRELLCTHEEDGEHKSWSGFSREDVQHLHINEYS